MRIIKLFTDNKFGIFVCTFVLIIPIASSLYWGDIHKQQEIIHNIQKFKLSQPMELLKLCVYEIQIEEIKNIKEESKTEKFIITAYDLSIASCGKSKSHKAYGISRSGENLIGKNYKTARIVAVNPKVIPLGSKLKIEFIDNKYSKYSGVYTASDTTSKTINDHIIDLYLAESAYEEAKNFGVTNAMVEIINE